MVDGYNIAARNQHAESGAYEFHIHRAYIIYDLSVACMGFLFQYPCLDYIFPQLLTKTS